MTSRTSDAAARDLAIVGRVVRPHGNRGQMVIAAETDFGAKRFRVGSMLYLIRDGGVDRVTITASRADADRWIVGLEGVSTIDAAEALRGAELAIRADELEPLAGGGYYIHDLVGCRVETVAGRLVGTVARVETTTGTPLLELRTPAGELLVPLAEEICREIDIAGKRIVIDPPEGLIELNG